MITLTREEAQSVLDALESWQKTCLDCGRSSEELGRATKPLQEIRTKLAQPEPEPVAWMHNFIDYVITKNRPTDITRNAGRWTPLYTAPPQPEPEPVADKYLMEIECTKCGAKQDGILTVNAPPQREWQGLTDEERYSLMATMNPLDFARAIEAKLREKNYDKR